MWGVLMCNAPPNNCMHPTADTVAVMLRERLGAACDAGRSAAFLTPKSID